MHCEHAIYQVQLIVLWDVFSHYTWKNVHHGLWVALDQVQGCAT
jgi:hypothetical protein